MALGNFLLTVAGVTAVVLLLRSDVKQSASIFRRNVRQIRNWLEEESSAAAKYSFQDSPFPLIFGSQATFVVLCFVLRYYEMVIVLFPYFYREMDKAKPKELQGKDVTKDSKE